MKLIEPDEDNGQLFAQRRFCLECEETFTLGDMLPGKLAMDPMRCPYCLGAMTARDQRLDS